MSGNGQRFARTVCNQLFRHPSNTVYVPVPVERLKYHLSWLSQDCDLTLEHTVNDVDLIHPQEPWIGTFVSEISVNKCSVYACWVWLEVTVWMFGFGTSKALRVNIFVSSYVISCGCVRLFRGGSSRGHRQQAPYKIQSTPTRLHGFTSREELEVDVL